MDCARTDAQLVRYVIYLFESRDQIVNKFWINKDLSTSFPLTEIKIYISMRKGKMTGNGQVIKKTEIGTAENLQKNIPNLLPCYSCSENGTKEVTVRTGFQSEIS